MTTSRAGRNPEEGGPSLLTDGKPEAPHCVRAMREHLIGFCPLFLCSALFLSPGHAAGTRSPWVPNLRETSRQTVPEDSMFPRLIVKPSQPRARRCACQPGALDQNDKMVPEGMGPRAARATGGFRAHWPQSRLGASWEPRGQTSAGCLSLLVLFSPQDIMGAVLLALFCR